MYSEKVMENFRHPKNVGKIKDADGVGEVGNPKCGDLLTLYIKVGKKGKEKVIKDIKFNTLGCAAAIAVSSMITQMAKGKTIKQAEKITNHDIVQELGDLPRPKYHCSLLGAEALHAAIKSYKSKLNKTIQNEK
jgi:nitrogen fixation protein NifU and related proteins